MYCIYVNVIKIGGFDLGYFNFNNIIKMNLYFLDFIIIDRIILFGIRFLWIK